MNTITIELAKAYGFNAGVAYANDTSDIDTAPAGWPPMFARRWNVGFDQGVETLGEVKEVNNLMSGKSVVIDVNTPLCCDPSSETYWSA